MSTLKDIAARTGLSMMAVSRILNGKNKEEWPACKQRAETVRMIAAELGYRPDSAARAMRAKTSKHIGAVLLNTGSFKLHYMAAYEFVAGINERLNLDGYTLSVIRLSDLTDTSSRHRFLRERMLDGVICVGLHEDADFIRKLEESTENCVWLDSNTWRKHDCIRRDEFQSALTATARLIEVGCHTIIWKNWIYPHFSSAERDAGVRSALQTAKEVELVELGASGYRDVFSSLCGRGATAVRKRKIGVVAANSHAALQTLVAGTKLGLRPGVDYALVSCDETSENCYIWPELTRVSHWRFEYGEKAAAMMLDLLKGVKTSSRKLQGVLVKGETDAVR